MPLRIESPVAVCQRPPGSVWVSADASDDQKDTLLPVLSQPQFPGGLDPFAMPILAAHWVGFSGGEASGLPEAGRT